MTPAELSVSFFLQMFVILAVCRVVGWAARRIGQPQVVGEMIAGVLLGPSVIGLLGLTGLPAEWVAAAARSQQALFPPESLKTLYVGA
jgi:Kef-type K+ transport system membrane component KefB